MIYPSSALKCPDDVAGEVLDAEISIVRYRRRKIHAMNRAQSSGFYDPEKLRNDEPKMIEKLIIGLAVSQISWTIAVAVEISERRAKDTEVYS
jgi:hypothetical protein